MSKTIGGVATLVALSAGIINNVDPVLLLTRAGVAGVAGFVVGALIGALARIGAPGTHPFGANLPIRERSEVPVPSSDA